MRFRHDKGITAGSGDLLKNLCDMSVLVFGEPPYFLNRVF